jgi:alpha-beta hydrolase superfamily lysophospholipase
MCALTNLRQHSEGRRTLHGTQDKAAKPGGSQFFQDTAGSKDKTLKLYDGAFHDPLNDIGREQVTMDIVNWISPHLTQA